MGWGTPRGRPTTEGQMPTRYCEECAKAGRMTVATKWLRVGDPIELDQQVRLALCEPCRDHVVWELNDTATDRVRRAVFRWVTGKEYPR
jgi:hypothetical protein